MKVQPMLNNPSSLLCSKSVIFILGNTLIRNCKVSCMMQSERNQVDFSPVNQKAVEEVDLRTPCDASYSKDHFPEITPDGDLQKVKTTLCLPRLNKVCWTFFF